MNSFELQSFQMLIDAGNRDAMLALTVKRPVLLSESLWPELREWLSTQPSSTQRQGAEAMTMLAALQKMTIDNWNRYPFGDGPLDRILARLLQGEIDEAQASIIASTQEITRNLSTVYVRARMMQSVLQALNGDWRQPLLGYRVILAALSARKAMFTRDQKAMESIGAIEYSRIALRAIWETADGRYLNDAVSRLKSVASQELAPWHSPGAAWFALGALHLDPYISSRPSSNFKQQMDAWMRRPRESMGAKFTDEVARETRLPAPLAAFTAASEYFLTSANLEAGPIRGLSLKGYIEAEAWKKVAGGATADLRAFGAEALALLASDRYAEPRAAVAGLLKFAGQEQGTAAQAGYDPQKTAREFLARDLEELVEQQGLVATTELLNRVAEAVQGDGALAVALWRKTLPLMLRRDETALSGFLQNGLLYITNGLADDTVKNRNSAPAAAASQPKKGQAPARTPLEEGKDVWQRSQAEAWSEEKLVATLLLLAAGSQLTNDDLEGAELLRMAESVSERLAAEWNPLLKWFSALLYRGEASNQFALNDYSKAIKAYALSALYFLEAHLPAGAADAMEQAADLVDRSNSQISDFATYFAIVLPELERQGGSRIVARIRDLGRAFFPMTIKPGGRNSASFPLVCMLKGVLLGAAWRAGGNLEWIDSEDSRQMLQRIDASLRAAPGGGMLQNIGGLTMDDLLTVFAEDTEMAAGEGPDSTLHNLEVTFDHELRRRIGERRGRQKDWIPTAEGIQGLLGPETVLIDYYSGNLPNGNAGLYLHILSQESIVLGAADFGIPGMQTFLGDAQYQADILALNVSGARRAIQDDAGTDAPSEEVRQSLSSTPYVSGPTEEILKKLRQQDKWHLCIVPFGPLHFFPFHLLPYGDGLLGDEWAVTYLPALAMLQPRGEKPADRQRQIASFGIEFRNRVPHGLNEIRGAEDEARRVANIFGEPAFVNTTATESAVKEAFAASRRIHISTHGLLTVSAPSFQRVYLTPDSSNDGILFAWELLRHDLRGLDLLTLSACETALGRVDKGDNLRSFATNALIAGAQTVVGTLWPVRSDVTKTFFESFYRETKGGAGKREAFQTAQLTARLTYPQYRDWGAFWYTGLW